MQIAIYFFEFDGCTLSVASMVIVLNLKTWRGYIRHVSISNIYMWPLNLEPCVNVIYMAPLFGFKLVHGYLVQFA